MLGLQRDEYLPLKVIKETVKADTGDEEEPGRWSAAARPGGGSEDLASGLRGCSWKRCRLPRGGPVSRSWKLGVVCTHREGGGSVRRRRLCRFLSIAEDFLRFGIEPRHLTMCETFQRESSFFEALVARSAETLAELRAQTPGVHNAFPGNSSSGLLAQRVARTPFRRVIWLPARASWRSSPSWPWSRSRSTPAPPLRPPCRRPRPCHGTGRSPFPRWSDPAARADGSRIRRAARGSRHRAGALRERPRPRPRPMASVTKVMTALLTLEALRWITSSVSSRLRAPTSYRRSPRRSGSERGYAHRPRWRTCCTRSCSAAPTMPRTPSRSRSTVGARLRCAHARARQLGMLQTASSRRGASTMRGH